MPTVLEENEHHDMYGEDKGEVVDIGFILSRRFKKEQISVEEAKVQTTRSLYPNAFEYGTVKLSVKGDSEIIEKANLFQFEVGIGKEGISSPSQFDPSINGKNSDVLNKWRKDELRNNQVFRYSQW